MTDNSVDVSGCIFHSLTTMGYVGYNYCKCFECVCECHNDCYYKQLKCSEAQCEAMFVSHTDLEKKYEQQLDQLKVELEQEKALKETYLTCYKAKHEDIDGELFKLKQTLTEIKEIAKNMNNECFYDDFDCEDCDMKNGCTYQGKIKILQKISECEAENE